MIAGAAKRRFGAMSDIFALRKNSEPFFFRAPSHF
jgi:hypothetical protein